MTNASSVYRNAVVMRVAFLLEVSEVEAEKRVSKHQGIVDQFRQSGKGHISAATSILIADMGDAIESLSINVNE